MNLDAFDAFQENRRKQRLSASSAARERLQEMMRQHSVTEIEIDYDGSGDSGSVEDVRIKYSGADDDRLAQ